MSEYVGEKPLFDRYLELKAENERLRKENDELTEAGAMLERTIGNLRRAADEPAPAQASKEQFYADEIDRLRGEVDHLLGLLKARGEIIDNLRAASEPSADAEKLLEEYDACWIEDERLLLDHTRVNTREMKQRFDKARAAVLAAMRAPEPPSEDREFPLDTRVREVFGETDGTVVAVDTRYEVECTDGKHRFYWHRQLDRLPITPRGIGHIYSPREGTEVCGVCGFHKREHASEHMPSETKAGDRCVQCEKPLPPVSQWSMPACEECTQKSDETVDPLRAEIVAEMVKNTTIVDTRAAGETKESL